MQDQQERKNLENEDVACVIERVKEYIPEVKYSIRLSELITAETEDLFAQLGASQFNTHVNWLEGDFKELFQDRLRQYEEVSMRLVEVLSTLSFYSRGEQSRLLTRSLRRVSSQVQSDGNPALLRLQFYPALLCMYGAGITALENGNYPNLAAMLLHTEIAENLRRYKAGQLLYPLHVFEDTEKLVPRPNAEREHVPASNYLFDVLREPLQSLFPDENVYQENFDVLEYLIGLTCLDLSEDKHWAPSGAFLWRYTPRVGSPTSRFEAQGIAQGDDWALLREGFFGGSIGNFQAAVKQYHDLLSRINFEWRSVVEGL